MLLNSSTLNAQYTPNIHLFHGFYSLDFFWHKQTEDKHAFHRQISKTHATYLLPPVSLSHELTQLNLV